MTQISQKISSLNQDVNYAYTFGTNHNPADVEVSETINIVLVIDTSSSVRDYAPQLNSALNEFITRMQKSHVASQLFVSTIEFGSDVTVTSGFQQISDVKPIDITPRVQGMTALYKACSVGVQNAISYRNDLENAGVECKTLFFVITDGEDNHSGLVEASHVKALIDDLLKEERNIFSFESILFGVGDQANFEAAQIGMGIKWLAKISTSADDMRKMIGFISSSVTSTASGQGMSAPAF